MMIIIVPISSSKMPLVLAMLWFFLLSASTTSAANTPGETFVIAQIPDQLIAEMQGILSNPYPTAIKSYQNQLQQQQPLPPQQHTRVIFLLGRKLWERI